MTKIISERLALAAEWKGNVFVFFLILVISCIREQRVLRRRLGLVGSQFPGGLGLGTFKGRNVGLGRGLRLETLQLVPDSVFPQTCFSLVFVSPLGQDGELGA